MNENVQRVLFYLVLFFLPFQTRYFLFLGELGGSFYEYGSIAVYVWEILVLVLVGISVYRERIQKKRIFTYPVRFVLGVFVFAILWSWFFSLDAWVSVRHVLFLAEGACLVWVAKRITGNVRIVLKILCVAVVLQTSLGVWQFLGGGSAENTWLGIATRDAQQLGDSVVLLDGDRYLRAYGLMSHPNVLGGFLVVVILFAIRCWEKKRDVLIQVLVCISSVGLFFTFSRGAWVALVLGGLWYAKRYPEMRERWVYWVIIPFVLLGALFHPFVWSRWGMENRLEQQSVEQRIEVWPQAGSVFTQYWFFGTGMGAYTRALWLENSLQPVWAYQPLHVSLVLVVMEWGFVLSICFFFLFWRFFLRDQSWDVWIVLGVLGMFDHYVVTMPFFLPLVFLIFSLKSPVKS